ncbi:MAG TPA: hypothetical protein VHZ73_12695 [Vicinamibacterales bacterium]|nr:hypothetical protein [Vicinamibacterales bacterium]
MRTYFSFASVLVLAGCVALAGAACKTSSPAQPSSTASGGTSIISPAPLTPANGTTVAFISLPAKLTITNGTSTSGSPLTYTFEVAYDAGFSSKIATQSGVTEGSGGQTSTTITSLLASNTYYWHARADGGSTTGVFSPTYQFKVGGQVTLAAPVPVSPVNNAIVTPTGNSFTVTNAVKTGPAGPLTYKFDISTSQGFSPIVATQTVSEGATQTTYTPSQAFTAGLTYYWRVTVNDATNGVTTTTQPFVLNVISSVQVLLAAEEGQTLWPGAQPPGTNGHSSLGPGWDVANAVYVDGTPYVTPEIAALRVFDLIDRGMAPPDALAWMQANGYDIAAGLWYPDTVVVGFHFQYMGGINGLNGQPSATGQWNLTQRAE